MKARSVSGCGFSELMVNVSVLTLPGPMVAGLKALENETPVGGRPAQAGQAASRQARDTKTRIDRDELDVL